MVRSEFALYVVDEPDKQRLKKCDWKEDGATKGHESSNNSSQQKGISQALLSSPP